MTPGYILRDGTAFFLGQAGHNRDEKFALAVQGVDVLLFKVDLDALLLELSHRNEAVHRVSGKSADRLGDNEVNLSVQCVLDHLIEAIALFHVGAGNTLVGVNLHELPFGMAFDVLCVVVDLSLVTGELLIAVRGYSGVTGYPALGHRSDRHSCKRVDG